MSSLLQQMQMFLEPNRTAVFLYLQVFRLQVNLILSMFAAMKKILLLWVLGLFMPLLIWAVAAEETSPAVMFKQLSTTDGLSNNSVRCVFRDSRGFLWIGTESGLNKYDGYAFRQYYRSNSNLPGDAIHAVFEDPEHDIWVQQASGYSIYDYKTGHFDGNYKQKLECLQIPGRNILQVGSTADGDFWAYDADKLYLRTADNRGVKTFPLRKKPVSNVQVSPQKVYVTYADERLYVIDRQTSQAEEVEVPETYKAMVAGLKPVFYVGLNGDLWLYTFQNSLLLHKEAASGQWENIRLTSDAENLYNRVQRICDLGNGQVWILTSHTGLFIYNTTDKSLANLRHSSTNPNTLASNNLSAIFPDHDGTVWVGNFKHGVSYYSPSSQIIFSYESPDNEDILAFCQDPQTDEVYYGTDGNGLLRIGGGDVPEKVATPANIIVDLSMDGQGRLWMGTFQKGLLVRFPSGSVRQYTTANSGLLDNAVYTVEADRNGYVWLGTLGGHIQRLDPRTGEFLTMLNRPWEYSVRDMYYDKQRTLYVATLGGLILIDTETLSYDICSENNRFREQDVQTVYEDSRGMVWLGHSHGLSVWDAAKDSIYFIDQSQGLAANLVRAIVEDKYHRMWIGTGNGVSCIQQVNGSWSILNYSVNDGLICNDANVHAILRTHGGNILIGTPRGWQCILPQETIPAAYEADVVLTDISLKSGKVLPDVLEGRSPESAERLVLKEADNTFVLSFSALNLVEADKVKYAYRIGGNSSPWMNVEGNRVTLSMLPVGHYTLEVRAGSPQGVWSPRIKRLEIRVLPPWWRSWWAYAGYMFVVLALLWQVIRYVRARQRMEAIQQAVEEENEKQQRVTNLKLQFFANISHELRTPLSLIINPLDEFLENHSEFRQGLLGLARQNAAYLLELINQLLDFRRLDAQAESLHCKHDNVLIILSEIFHSFDIIARKKNITYTMTCPHSSVFMDFDYDKVRKIATNILSNAFKFTPAKGSISLHVEVKDNCLELSFADTGCGVDDASKEKIFTRFYQSDRTGTHSGGSGIGLHITSEYVKMHRGTICVKDNRPVGAVFIVTLPLHQNAVAEEPLPAADDEATVEEKVATEGFCILLVDDNPDFLGFLADSLGKEYKVLKAQNGKQALERLEQEDADLVVSDVMMPEMDGLELCRAIKTDIRYSHIPVILLTAKAGEDHQLEGLSMGADDYVTKPFNMAVLKARIRNIIDTNAKRRESFDRDIRIEPSRITITPLDRQLVEKAIQIVEENIADSEFSVEELASRLNISRSYFYKKLTKITGKKPIEFIRTIRMKRACQLLEESQLQVSEIAYMLGYNSPRIFSRHFKDEFGISPSEYLRRQSGTVTPGQNPVASSPDWRGPL